MCAPTMTIDNDIAANINNTEIIQFSAFLSICVANYVVIVFLAII